MYRKNINRFPKKNKGNKPRYSDRIYSKSPHEKGDGSLPQLDKHNNKKLKLLKVGEEYEFCQNKEGQVKVDDRNKQMLEGTMIEWYHGKTTKKYFIITGIKEGIIEDIPSKFNGYILTLMRVS